MTDKKNTSVKTEEKGRSGIEMSEEAKREWQKVFTDIEDNINFVCKQKGKKNAKN